MESQSAQTVQPLSYASSVTETATMVDVAAMLFRVAGVIVLFVVAIGVVDSTISYIRFPSGRSARMGELIAMLVTSSVGVSMIWFAMPVSRWLVTPRVIPFLEGRTAANHLQRALIAAIGAAYGANTLPGLLVYGFRGDVLSGWYQIARLAVCAWMILGNQGMLRIFRGIRTFGITPPARME